MLSEFKHLHSAHCETGVTTALLGHQGLELSEPMAFGIGSGLFFFFPPLIKVVGMPLISYRSFPGTIFKQVCKRLGVKLELKRYSTQARGVEALDSFMDAGTPVGLQTNMFWLTYFPREFRSQFNGHNLVALERDGERYLLSDPMLEAPIWLDAEALNRARFSKGVLAPRGCLYRPLSVPTEVDLSAAILGAIRSNAKGMLSKAPIVGVRGIRRLAKHVRAWGNKIPDERTRLLLLGHIIRMQEEVGSGGAGFRYLYAAFLQEAGERLESKRLLGASERMTEIGDLWRANFAVTCGRIIKGRTARGDETFDTAADALLECAAAEESLYRSLLADLPAKASMRVPVASLGAAL